MELITSRRNPICSEIRKLRSSRKYRYEKGLFLADGIKLVREAIHWGSPIEMLVLQEGIELPEVLPAEIPVTWVSAEVMSYVSSMDSPQGMLAICRMRLDESESLPTRFLVLNELQDPGNVGTILRTADALDIPVVISDGCADPFSEKTVRASMGAVFRTNPRVLSSDVLLKKCKDQGIPVAVTRLDPNAKDIRDYDFERCAVVIGNEGHGVSLEYSDSAEISLIIPMNPRCESFNAASAATIVMWQMKLKR